MRARRQTVILDISLKRLALFPGCVWKMSRLVEEKFYSPFLDLECFLTSSLQLKQERKKRKYGKYKYFYMQLCIVF